MADKKIRLKDGFLYLPQGAELPHSCVKCNKTTDLVRVKGKFSFFHTAEVESYQKYGFLTNLPKSYENPKTSLRYSFSLAMGIWIFVFALAIEIMMMYELDDIYVLLALPLSIIHLPFFREKVFITYSICPSHIKDHKALSWILRITATISLICFICGFLYSFVWAVFGFIFLIKTFFLAMASALSPPFTVLGWTKNNELVIQGLEKLAICSEE